MNFKRIPYLNVLKADNKYQLRDIRIFDFDTQEVLYKANQGWLSSNRETTIEFDLPTCKRKIKLNLSVKHPFIIKEESTYNKAAYVLYIPRSLVNFKDLGETISFKTDTQIIYQNTYQIDLKCALNSDEEIKNREFKVTSSSRTVATEFGNSVRFWEEKLEEEGIEISFYNLEKLLKKYKLMEKLDE